MMYQTRRRGVRPGGAPLGQLGRPRPFLTVDFDRSVDFDRGFSPGEGPAVGVIRSPGSDSHVAASNLDLSTVLDEEFQRRNRFQSWAGWLQPIRGLWRKVPRFR